MDCSVKFSSPTADDYYFLNELRTRNFEEYQVLVNMHLTRTELVLDAEDLDALWVMESGSTKTSSGESSSRLSSFVAASGKVSRAAFGNVLRERLKVFRRKRRVYKAPYSSFFGSGSSEELLVSALMNMIAFLEREENLKTEGTFRKSGAQSRQSALLTALRHGEHIDFDKTAFTVHDVATAFKIVLRELPQPIFSDAHYPIYLEVAEWARDSDEITKTELQLIIKRQISVIRLLLLILPSNVFGLLHCVLRLLRRASKYQEANKMTEYNLARLFTPALFLPRSVSDEHIRDVESVVKLLALIIEHIGEVFHPPKELILDVLFALQRQDAGNVCSSSINREYREVDEVIVQPTFSFVNMKRSVVEDRLFSAETAVAALYAYIQQMPEGPEKQKRVKQFHDYNLRRLINQDGQQRSLKRKACVGSTVAVHESVTQCDERPVTKQNRRSTSSSAIDRSQNAICDLAKAISSSSIHIQCAIQHGT